VVVAAAIAVDCCGLHVDTLAHSSLSLSLSSAFIYSSLTHKKHPLSVRRQSNDDH